MASSAPNINFAGWVERTHQGDAAAEDEVVRWFQPRLQVFFASRTRRWEVAQELVQEALMALLCAMRNGQVQQVERLDAFAYGIARNLLMNRYRREAQEQLEPLPLDLPYRSEPDEDDKRRDAVRAIEELPASDQTILRMTMVDNLKPGEIAAKIGLSSDVVRQRKTRALKKLLDRLRPLSRNSTGTPLHFGRRS